MKLPNVIVMTLFLLGTVYTKDALPEDFEVYFKNGYVDTFESAKDSFIRSSCDARELKAKVKLTNEEVKKLKDLANQTDFFSLERNQNPRNDENGEVKISICGPCASFSLGLISKDKANTVMWSCSCNRNIVSTPQSIEPLVLELRKMIYNRAEVKSLSSSSCRFY